MLLSEGTFLNSKISTPRMMCQEILMTTWSDPFFARFFISFYFSTRHISKLQRILEANNFLYLFGVVYLISKYFVPINFCNRERAEMNIAFVTGP